MNNLPVSKNSSVDSSAELVQLVSFRMGNEEYGVEVLKVREIIRAVSITHMPNTPHYIEGIINLRGKVIPIISMRKKFGFVDIDVNSQTRVIIMDVRGELLGFTVDAVSEVMRIAAGDIQPSPSIAAGGIDQQFIAGVINHGERLLILLDLDMMFSQEEYSAFGGM